MCVCIQAVLGRHILSKFPMMCIVRFYSQNTLLSSFFFPPNLDEKAELLNPMGTVQCNPNTESAATLLIKFINMSDCPVYYPSIDKVWEWVWYPCLVAGITMGNSSAPHMGNLFQLGCLFSSLRKLERTIGMRIFHRCIDVWLFSNADKVVVVCLKLIPF